MMTLPLLPDDQESIAHDARKISEKKFTQYVALSRKYRPTSLDELKGQKVVVRLIKNALRSGKIGHAFLFTGIRGVGKTTTARLLARALNYETEEIKKPTGDFEKVGFHCDAIMTSHHTDVIEMDAASNNGITDVREMIENIRYKPLHARYKIYIIDEVHMLSKPAFNGLLKILEEPPKHVKFLLATTEIKKIPITIISRCQRITLRRLQIKTVIELLKGICHKEKADITDKALMLLAYASEGSARDGVSLLDQCIVHADGCVDEKVVRACLGLAETSGLLVYVETLYRGDVKEAMSLWLKQYEQGQSEREFLHALSSFVALLIRFHCVSTTIEEKLLSLEEKEKIKKFIGRVTLTSLEAFWQILLKALDDLRIFPYGGQVVDIAIVRLCASSRLLKIDVIGSALQIGSTNKQKEDV